jgi:hypothetical protein
MGKTVGRRHFVKNVHSKTNVEHDLFKLLRFDAEGCAILHSLRPCGQSGVADLDASTNFHAPSNCYAPSN